MRIIKIVKLKNGKYKLIFDEYELETYDEVIIKYNLLYKTNIDKRLLDIIEHDTRYYCVYNKAMKYVLSKMRSENQLKLYLSKFALSDEEKQTVITHLKNINLIDDEKYCMAFVNDKTNLTNDGINKIKFDLLNENISIEIVEKALNNVDKTILYNKLEKIILKKLNSNNKYSNYHIKQKIINEMINFGYSKTDIINILDSNLLSEDEIFKKEANKLYNKLKQKYSGNELIIKTKQKLLLKGFKIDNLEEIIVDDCYYD